VVVVFALAPGAHGEGVRQQVLEIAPRVVAVELRSDAPVEKEQELLDLVAIEPGSLYDFDAVRRTLRNLHASGLVGMVEARTRTEGEGVRVIFAVYPSLRVESVSLEGSLCVRESILKNRIEQQEAMPLSESRVIRSVYQLQDLLQGRGYLDATVLFRPEIHQERRVAEVVYLVDCGEPTLVESVEFEGDLDSLSSEELEAQLRLTADQRLERMRLREDAERLEHWLFGSGFRLAEVGEPREVPGESPYRVALTYPVSLGPRFELKVVGTDEETLRRRKLLDLLERERFDEALLLNVLSGIRRYLQRKGHYKARVDWRSRQNEDVFSLEIWVWPGPVFRLTEISLVGNDLVTEEELAVRMATRRQRAFGGGGGHLVDEILEEDLANLRAYYALQGFAEAEIGPAEVVEDGDHLKVSIAIVEGVRKRVVSVSFWGVTEPAVRENLARLPVRPGGPFHRLLLEDTLEALRAEYEEAGYLSAQVAADVEWDRSSTLADVTIRVLEGPQALVDRVVLRGNTKTQSDVIHRALGIEPGQVVNRRRLLDGQRRIYRLGIFSRAEVRLAPALPFATHRDVLVLVQEGRDQRATFGLGYDSEDGVRTLLGYSHSNIGGKGISARFDVRISRREEQFRALARQPSLGRWQVPMSYAIFDAEEKRESFDSGQRGLQVEASRPGRSSRLGLLYTYKVVDVEDSDPALASPEPSIDRIIERTEISSLTPSFSWDRRDDPLVPTRGWKLGLQSEWASSLFSAEAEFLKLFAQYTSYLNLDSLGVVAGSLRIGVIEPLGSTAADLAAQIPISELFFAGGRTTHRAYRRDLLGVPGETLFLCGQEDNVCFDRIPDGQESGDFRRVAAGGTGLVLLNLDYRFPIAGSLGGTIFFDSGNVWADWGHVDLGEIRSGVGLGLRFLSPVGPLRLEVGRKLDRQPGEGSTVVFFSFGNPF
jgi:outer membrane protein assembly complex protein YaeT